MPDNQIDQLNDEEMLKNLVDFAVEFWRFNRMFANILDTLDVGSQKKYINKYYWFWKKFEHLLATADISLINVEKEPYDPGMAATPINLDEFEPGEPLVVEKMIEPVIMRKNALIKTGTVILMRAQPDGPDGSDSLDSPDSLDLSENGQK
ncbi:MAG: hypothetical protein LBE31_10315 [Deltaproteobacteria bacterium]|jgi:hypothetical protein|nr:hypothetical protein [Deltaproteobacteria bacterium]